MKRIVVALMLASMVSVSGGGPAGAALAANCSFRLVPVSRIGVRTEARPELIGCYESYDEAVEAGLGGSVDLPSNLTPATLTQALLDVSPAANVMIGTEWDNASFVLPSQSYFASATCSASNTWDVNYVGDAWNDRFESGKGFGGCDTNKKFAAADFGGAVVTCTPNCSNYGAGMNNEVSSLRWKP